MTAPGIRFICFAALGFALSACSTNDPVERNAGRGPAGTDSRSSPDELAGGGGSAEREVSGDGLVSRWSRARRTRQVSLDSGADASAEPRLASQNTKRKVEDPPAEGRDTILPEEPAAPTDGPIPGGICSDIRDSHLCAGRR